MPQKCALHVLRAKGHVFILLALSDQQKIFFLFVINDLNYTLLIIINLFSIISIAATIHNLSVFL